MSPDFQNSMTSSFSLLIREHFPRLWGRYWVARAVGCGYREVMDRSAPGHAGLRSMICALRQWYWFCSLQAIPAQIVSTTGRKTSVVLVALPEGVPLWRLRDLRRVGQKAYDVLEPLARDDSGHPVLFLEAGAGSAVLELMQSVISDQASLSEELGPSLWGEVESGFGGAIRALEHSHIPKHPAAPVGVFRHEAQSALKALHRFNQVIGAVYAGESKAHAA